MNLDFINICAFLSALLLAALGTSKMRAYALRASLLDEPGHRSLHKVATPRGGGVAITASVLAVCLTGLIAATSAINIFQLSFMFLAMAMSALGFADDRYVLSAKSRLQMQVAIVAATVVLYFVSSGYTTSLTTQIISGVVLLLFCTWMTNLYNFMDGSDGIAALQGLTVSLGLALLTESMIVRIPAIALAGACSGFLIFNWQPAKIFMGDAGSVFLGFTSAVLIMLVGKSDGSVIALSALVLHGAFVVDATVTLLTRLLRGKQPHVAHRSHTYQRLIQSGLSHRQVALAYGLVNLVWLLPMSLLISNQPALTHQLLLAGLSWTPLAFIAFYFKAGFD